MSFITRYRTWIGVVLFVIVAFFVYSYFFTGAPQPVLTSAPASTNAQVDADLIALLATLHSITLDDSIFHDPTFMSLKDFSQTLVPEPVGRTNPFAPLGSVSSGL
jgi:hypothetical protein